MIAVLWWTTAGRRAVAYTACPIKPKAPGKACVTSTTRLYGWPPGIHPTYILTWLTQPCIYTSQRFREFKNYGIPCNFHSVQRCLLVDDDDDSREAYAEYLRGFGYEVQTLADSRNAMSAVAEHRPDIVLVDLQMPHVDGFELIRLIKARPGPEVPVIVISACVFATDHALAEAAGCNAFLTKPALPHDVLATIRMLLPSSIKGGGT